MKTKLKHLASSTLLIFTLTACGSSYSSSFDVASDASIAPKGLKAIYRYTVKENSFSPGNFDLINGGLNGPIGPIYRETTIALFEDGTYTDEIHDMIENSHKPESIGKWRFKEKKLQLKKGSSAFKYALKSYLIDAGSKNQKLSGCFRQNRGSQNMYADVSKDFCFDTKGNYIYTGKVPLNDARIRKGKYRIDDYTIEFTSANGDKVKQFFAFLLDNKKHIEIGDSRYVFIKKSISDVNIDEIETASRGKNLLIVNNAPNRNSVCKEAEDIYRNGGFQNISTQEKTQSVSCADFGLTEDGKACKIFTYKGKSVGTKTCLLWHDGK